MMESATAAQSTGVGSADGSAVTRAGLHSDVLSTVIGRAGSGNNSSVCWTAHSSRSRLASKAVVRNEIGSTRRTRLSDSTRMRPAIRGRPEAELGVVGVGRLLNGALSAWASLFSCATRVFLAVTAKELATLIEVLLSGGAPWGGSPGNRRRDFGTVRLTDI